MKVTNAELHRCGQSFLDELEDVDWGDDIRQRRVEKNGIPPMAHGQQGVVGEDIFENFEPGIVEEQGPEGRDEIPFGSQELGIPEGAREIEYNGSTDPATGQQLDQQKLAYDGIDNREIISFDYTNRFGMYAGTRTVEPHYTFVASTTGNEVLVTWDIDQNDIRAFIVGNMHPFGVRYEGVQFSPRGKIMRGNTDQLPKG